MSVQPDDLTPGQCVDKAATKLHNAAGKLLFMFIKKKLSRAELHEAEELVEGALELIRSALRRDTVTR